MPVVGDRIRVEIELYDLDAQPLPGVVPDSIEASKNDATPWIAADIGGGGSWNEIGGGKYYYESSADEADGAQTLAINVAYTVDATPRIGFAESGGPEAYPVGRIATALWDYDGAPIAGIVPEPAELETTIDDAAWGAFAGAWTEIGDGYYVYQGAGAELARVHSLALRTVGIPNVRDQFASEPIEDAGEIGLPTITVISPDENVTPGDPGGFPADYATAKDTPIVLRVEDLSSALAYAAVVRVLPSGGEEVIYRRGAFVAPYAALSTTSGAPSGIDLHCRRDGGWPPAEQLTNGKIQFAVDALDTAGNLSA